MHKILTLFKLVCDETIDRAEVDFENFHVSIYRVDCFVRVEVKEKV